MDRDVYYRPKGAKEVQKFRMFAIDAAEAVAKWPAEYSYMPPAGKDTTIIDKVDPSFALTGAETDQPIIDPALQPQPQAPAASVAGADK